MFMKVKQSSLIPVNGSSTARQEQRVPNTSLCVCLLFRWSWYIEVRNGTQPCSKAHHSKIALPVLTLRKASSGKERRKRIMGKNKRRHFESKDDSERIGKKGKLKRKQYEAKLDELNMELVKMQYWIKATG